MKNYILVLSLTHSENAYINLINYLKTATYWARPLHNVWIIKTGTKVTEIRDGIKSRLTPQDRVLIMEVNGANWGTSNISKMITDWMKINLFVRRH